MIGVVEMMGKYLTMMRSMSLKRRNKELLKARRRPPKPRNLRKSKLLSIST